MIIDRNYEERLYSTGSDELDELLERAFCEGYEYAQREFNIKSLEAFAMTETNPIKKALATKQLNEAKGLAKANKPPIQRFKPTMKKLGQIKPKTIQKIIR